MQGKICRLATHTGLVVLLAVSLTSAAAPAVRVAPAPKLLDLRVTNGSAPFAGDRPLLTTVSPNGDGFRDRAIVHFRLTEPARVQLDVLATNMVRAGKGGTSVVWHTTRLFRTGPGTLTWRPRRS